MLRNLASDLLPTPAEVVEKEGYFAEGKGFDVLFQDSGFEILLPVSPIPLSPTSGASANLVFSKKKLGHEDAYKIECRNNGIKITAFKARGALYALYTLKQIFDLSNGKIPCFEINDRPVLSRRGFMLDVSRCKVPTMESIFGLIDLLSQLRYSEFQLYIEHTFAFSAHSCVWQDSSPLTGLEIQQIDQYCKARFIELVPNLNSFGHFERWLRHEPYKKLAECPDGFQRDEPFMVRDHGSVLKPNRESLRFIDSLYEEYLPHFSSSKFNVGLDEPWELGQGWSKAQVETKGKHEIYLKHLEGILELVEKRGKRMEFWADVLLEKPQNAQRLPSNASPIIWGYEADHPFAEQARTISACGLQYSLAPGTANWRSFSGRWHTARNNLKSACKNARKYGAEGILLTTWGDCGNHQPWATLYPPLFLASQLAWYGEDKDDQEIASAIDRQAFQLPLMGLGQAMIDLGKLDHILGFTLPNNSLAWFSLFTAQPEKLPQHLAEQTTVEKISDGLSFLEEISSQNIQPGNTQSSDWAFQEWELGLRLSKIGLLHAMSRIDQPNGLPSSATSNRELIEHFQKVWLLRARRGGLNEAVHLLEQAFHMTTPSAV